MALKGTLGDFSLTDILQLIGLQRKTGLLILRRGETEVSVAFDAGRIVGADSNIRPLEQRVGRLLVRTGRLTESRLDEALAIQRETLQRLGHVLAHQGWVEPELIRKQLTLQITETIYDLFRWDDGEYDFQPDVRVEWDKEHITPISCETLLMGGAQMVDEWPLIERVIPSRLTILHPTAAALEILATSASDNSEVRGSVYEDDIDFGFIPTDPLQEDAQTGGLQLTRKEAEILRWVDGHRSAAEIADLSEMGVFEAFKILARLVDARLVETVEQSGSAPRAETSRFFSTARPAQILSLAVALLVILGAAMAVQEVGAALFPRLERLPLPRPLASATWLGKASGLDRLRRAASGARLSRIEHALRTYFLAKGSWPESLAQLESSGLLTAGLIRDPWGRPYRYELADWGYRIQERQARPRLPPQIREHRFTPLERTFIEHP